MKTNMKTNTKYTITLVTIVLGFLAQIVGIVWNAIFYFQNPDMTELRRFIENPIPSIIAIAGVLVVEIVRRVLQKD